MGKKGRSRPDTRSARSRVASQTNKKKTNVQTIVRNTGVRVLAWRPVSPQGGLYEKIKGSFLKS